jgi:hypothetical protein
VSPVRSRIPQDGLGRHGEFVAATWAAANLPDASDLWFNLNWLGRVNDIDQLQHHPGIGTFVLEVKGHNIDQVVEFTPEATTFSDGKVNSPESQARKAAQQLNTWLASFEPYREAHSRPWIHSSVWWPQISRKDWIEKFQSPIALEKSLSMLFMEDMTSAERFLERLESVLEAPLQGQVGPRRANEPSKFDAMRDLLLNANGQARPSATKAATLTQPRSDTEKRVSKFAFGSTHNVVFEGLPGTGKTASLIEVAKLHASAGSRVLYVCFNKTLAAEIRQEILVRGEHDPQTWSARAIDLWDLYQLETNTNSGSQAEYLRRLRNEPEVERNQYDTILIDESQDLPDEAFEFLKLLTAPGGSWFAAFGEGQQLYAATEAPSLSHWKKTATRVSLLPSYRTAPAPVIIAQAAYRYINGSSAAARRWVTERVASAKKAASKTPTPLDIFSHSSVETGDRSISVVRRRLDQHAVSVVCSEIYPSLFDPELSRDLLILVLGKKGKYGAVKQALDESGVPWMDLVVGENRRLAPQENVVRLSTYHSARGLTARNVLIFEFENLPAAPSTASINNLANIVLSRATHKTRVVIPEACHEPHVTFLEEVITHTEQAFSNSVAG